MDEDTARRISQLQTAFEQGILDEDTYRSALTGLDPTGAFSVTAERSTIAQGTGSTAVGERGANASDVGGDLITGDHVIVVKEGGRVAIGVEATDEMKAVDRESALGRYLAHVIAHNRFLQLQGIHAGGRLVHIELDHIYVTLRATQLRTVSAEERWLTQEAALAPGERHRFGPGQTITETVTVSVNEALAEHRRLAVLGDPGCGKTTLLRYLALVYARDKAAGDGAVQKQLGLPETDRLPILLPLRQLGLFLKAHAEESTEGHRLMLDFFHAHLRNERIDVPLDFFDPYLNSGQAVILLDGLDEVAEPDLRRRVARLVEAFTRAYDTCRYIVTSRIVGYTGPARLGEDFATSTVRDFTLDDVALFLSHWHRLVAIGQMGPGAPAEAYAADQTRQLMDAIRGNEHIRELAINPLMLTVVALVHRDRVKLPDRRAELYAEAVDVLLGKWDEAKGLPVEEAIITGRPFDTGDRRLMLQSVALHMHEARLKEIEGEALRDLLATLFRDVVADVHEARHAVARFLRIFEERTGLLVARGEGVFAFSHLTFQEYLAALAVAGRDDHIHYTLARAADSWWREVILLEAGYLSTQSKERTTRFIEAIAEFHQEPELFHNLVLAAECLRDVGSGRVQENLDGEINRRLQSVYQSKPASWQKLRHVLTGQLKHLVEPRIAAATALAQIRSQPFWKLPYGEPEWVNIPGGEFTMGSVEDGCSFLISRFFPLLLLFSDDDDLKHTIHLEPFWIARVPTTNAQYELFIQMTGHPTPPHWEDGRIPRGLESHPVVYVDWHDAMGYCRWLTEMTDKAVTLPSEAEWEKAARGTDSRIFPWGNFYRAYRCNGSELGLGTTTPVGIFPEGGSPYGVLDMSGNVNEWTRSKYSPYPYDPADGRESLIRLRDLAIRGGSFRDHEDYLRCTSRFARAWNIHHGNVGFDPDHRSDYLGFRVVVSPFLPPLDSDGSDP